MKLWQKALHNFDNHLDLCVCFPAKVLNYYMYVMFTLLQKTAFVRTSFFMCRAVIEVWRKFRFAEL